MADRQALEPAHPADIDIQEPVVIDIHHRDAGRPSAVRRYPRGVRDIAKMQAARIQKDAIPLLVGSKEQVDKAVIIEVARPDPAAIVKIHVVENVEGGTGMKGIAEVKSGPVMFKRLEWRRPRRCFLRSRPAALQEQRHTQAQKK